MQVYFLPKALGEPDAALPREPALGCPLLGDTGLGSEACSHAFRSLLIELESAPDRDFVTKICPAGLQIAALRLPSHVSRDVLLVGQVLPALPPPEAVHRLRRQLEHGNSAELDFEYLCYRYASVPSMRPERFKHVLLLLQSFVHLLSQLPSQLLTGNALGEMSDCVKRALEELHQHYCDRVTSAEVAVKAVNV